MKMKPKLDLVVNSACCLLFSPILGMMIAGIVVAVLESILLAVVVVCGAVASLLLDVDYASFVPRIEVLKTTSFWIIAVCGCVGGVLWGSLEVRQHWNSFKVHGKGW